MGKEEEDGAKGTIERETKRKGEAGKRTDGEKKEKKNRRKRERNPEYRRDTKTPTITLCVENMKLCDIYRWETAMSETYLRNKEGG